MPTRQILGMICMGMGFLIGLIYGLKLLILAFKTSILWGLGYMFVPFVSLIFIIVHWDEAGSPFLKCFLSIPFYIIGMILMQSGQGI